MYIKVSQLKLTTIKVWDINFHTATKSSQEVKSLLPPGKVKNLTFKNMKKKINEGQLESSLLFHLTLGGYCYSSVISNVCYNSSTLTNNFPNFAEGWILTGKLYWLSTK